mmetsp:Transcript_2852/g.3023  ORF Transcript_2852/g.3023 Transcript_2852/m.3023 type:complete len:141 (+) Transcript_2852:37-459(+)
MRYQFLIIALLVYSAAAISDMRLGHTSVECAGANCEECLALNTDTVTSCGWNIESSICAGKETVDTEGAVLILDKCPGSDTDDSDEAKTDEGTKTDQDGSTDATQTNAIVQDETTTPPVDEPAKEKEQTIRFLQLFSIQP